MNGHRGQIAPEVNGNRRTPSVNPIGVVKPEQKPQVKSSALQVPTTTGAALKPGSPEVKSNGNEEIKEDGATAVIVNETQGPENKTPAEAETLSPAEVSIKTISTMTHQSPDVNKATVVVTSPYKTDKTENEGTHV